MAPTETGATAQSNAQSCRENGSQQRKRARSKVSLLALRAGPTASVECPRPAQPAREIQGHELLGRGGPTRQFGKGRFFPRRPFNRVAFGSCMLAAAPAFSA